MLREAQQYIFLLDSLTRQPFGFIKQFRFIH
jgi:hypothetical protein